MGMMNREYRMLLWIEEYGCITATQASYIFFGGLKTGRREAMVRLNMLVDIGKLKKYQSSFNGELQYYIKKRQTLHQIKLLDYLVYIISKGYTDIRFKPEGSFYNQCTIKTWVFNKWVDYRVDAIVEYDDNGIAHRVYLEIDNTHQSNGHELVRDSTGYNHDRYEHIARELHDKQYEKLRDYLPPEDHLEELVVVKNYLVHEHSRVAYHKDKEVNRERIIEKVDFNMYVYFLPWDLNSYFYPEQAKIDKAEAKERQIKKVAKNNQLKVEAKIKKQSESGNYSQLDLIDISSSSDTEKDIKLLRAEIKKLPDVLYFKNNTIYNI